MATTSWAADEEWELVNDEDGFVYKRLKRPRLDPTSSAPPPTSDPEAEERNRRERKKRILLNLRRRYQEEINQWELLSNTLKTMREKTLNQQQQEHPDLTTVSSLPPGHSSISTCRQLVDDLLVQVEAQEAVIHDISCLCNVAESLCSAQEERMKQSFIDLPIWESSPRELFQFLSSPRFC